MYLYITQNSLSQVREEASVAAVIDSVDFVWTDVLTFH